MSTIQKAVVGVFVAGGLLLFAGGLFLIGDRRLLFEPDFELETRFMRVTGLQVGTSVRVSGLPAGEVLEIRIPSQPSEPFGVRMRLRESLRSLVRTDSVAAVQTDGIVGSTFIQISPGTDAAPPVEPGGSIEGRDAIEFADLIEEGRDTFRVVAVQIDELADELSATMTSFAETTRNANAVMVGLSDGMRRITDTSVRIADEARLLVDDARGILQDARAGEGTLGRLLTDDTAYRHLVATVEEAEQTVGNLRAATARVRTVMDDLAARDGTAQQLVTALQATLVDTREVMSDLSESTEALKRNFLFRGFFRDRGFFDLDAVSREAYAAGALEGRDRTALRVWIDAEMLFAPDAAGVEQLTDDGRRRLESAMADLVRYPRDSPLVVEGYAADGDPGTAYLVSADRAERVREYLLRRFRREVTLTGVMPMGGEAAGSPRGDGSWAGVALTLFVENGALTAAP